MASTNKTPQLGLNQWAAGDEVIRIDFNGDNAKIDAAVVALQLHEFSYGTYKGTGVIDALKSVEVGFRPQVVLIIKTDFSMAHYSAIVMRGNDIMDGDRVIMRLTDTGFEVCNRKDMNYNTIYPVLANNSIYTYLAFR